MIIDELQGTFSDGQAITATAISTNVIQLNEAGTVTGESGQMKRNLGAGHRVPLLIQATETFAGGTSVTITLETADNAALSSGATVLASSGAIPIASLVAGYRHSFTNVLPDGTNQDFLGVRYTVVGTPTAGKITAAFTMGVDSNG